MHQLWAKPRDDFGVRFLYEQVPIPHFSYHVASAYDREKTKTLLSEIASRMKPFTVKTGGLGIFTGAQPVLFVNVARSPEMARLHDTLWPALAALSEEAQPYYQPTAWMPHITLAQGDLSHEKLQEVLHWLGGQNFFWTFEVNTLTMIEWTGMRNEVHQFKFNGANGS
ncbi:MAG: 2'-5' RNA ligase family protein [Anaerolineae bacterium]|nr:2'-5' RNA ligase family protein [Anaerolineae bacterium]